MDVLNEVRLENTLKIVDLIMKREEISRVDLARSMNLTKTTISNIVSNLIDEGLIREKRTVVSGLGRPQTMLEINSENTYIIGIGIMRDRVEGCLVNVKGRILKQSFREFTGNVSGNRAEIFNTLFAVIDEFFTGNSNLSGQIKAISLGISGPLDIKNGIIKQPPQFPELENIAIVDMLSKKYEVDVWIENDADMAALGERWYGGGRELDDFIYFFVDNGIGCGIIINGEIYHGKHDYAGEIGHLMMLVDNKFKYFEDLYGIGVILRRARTEISDEIKDIQDLTTKFNSGDKKSEILFEEVSRAMGGAILSMIHMFGISDIFIGGKAIYFGNKFISNIEKVVDENLFYRHDVSIRFSNLGNLAMPMGAAVHGIRKLFEKKIIRFIYDSKFESKINSQSNHFGFKNS
jgi:predicted NBD/HSP70 family sugar kinase